MELTEEDFLAMLNSASYEVMPCSPWTLAYLIATLNQIEGLLTIGRGHLEQNLQSEIRAIITLGRAVQHPEEIDADFLGFYTTNLMRLLDTVNPNEEEIEIILDNLAEAFNNTIMPAPEQNEAMLVEAITDIHYNDTYSIFNSLFEPKQNLEMDYIGKLDIGKITHFGIILISSSVKS